MLIQHGKIKTVVQSTGISSFLSMVPESLLKKPRVNGDGQNQVCREAWAKQRDKEGKSKNTSMQAVVQTHAWQPTAISINLTT